MIDVSMLSQEELRQWTIAFHADHRVIDARKQYNLDRDTMAEPIAWQIASAIYDRVRRELVDTIIATREQVTP